MLKTHHEAPLPSTASVLPRAITSQLIGIAATLIFVISFPQTLNQLHYLAFGQGLIAAIVSQCLKSEKWWFVLHLAFVPAIVAAQTLNQTLNLSSIWFLGGFLLLLLMYWSTFRSRVPLYLSNTATAQAILGLLPAKNGLRVVDFGAGTGGLLHHLAQKRKNAYFTGIEHAPLPFLMGKLRAAALPNFQMYRDDFWAHSLTDFDVVYVFLSPMPMPRLWQKAKAEMRPGSLVISNSFPIPALVPNIVIEVDDRRRTQLYCYSV